MTVYISYIALFFSLDPPICVSPLISSTDISVHAPPLPTTTSVCVAAGDTSIDVSDVFSH